MHVLQLVRGGLMRILRNEHQKFSQKLALKAVEGFLQDFLFGGKNRLFGFRGHTSMEKSNEAYFIVEHFVGGSNLSCRITLKDLLRPESITL